MRLCNDNVWWYPLEGIQLAPKSQWEPWVRRMHRKLAAQKTKALGGKARKDDFPRVAIP